MQQTVQVQQLPQPQPFEPVGEFDAVDTGHAVLIAHHTREQSLSGVLLRPRLAANVDTAHLLAVRCQDVAARASSSVSPRCRWGVSMLMRPLPSA